MQLVIKLTKKQRQEVSDKFLSSTNNMIKSVRRAHRLITRELTLHQRPFHQCGYVSFRQHQLQKSFRHRFCRCAQLS